MPREKNPVAVASRSNGHVPNGTTEKITAKNKRPQHKETFDQVPIDRAITTYFSYALMIFWGYIWDALRQIGLIKDGHGEATCKDVRK